MRKSRGGVFTQPGSNSEVKLADADFRFTPESGLKSDIGPCPKSATSGLMRCSNLCSSATRLFDHLCGCHQESWRQRETKCPCSLQINDGVDLDRLFDRNIAGRGSLKYFVDEHRTAPC